MLSAYVLQLEHFRGLELDSDVTFERMNHCLFFKKNPTVFSLIDSTRNISEASSSLRKEENLYNGFKFLSR